MLNNKRIILTGATRGIGLETLKLLVQGDNKILAVGRRIERLEGFDKSKVIAMKCDVSSPESVDAIIKEADSKLGGIDIFYCNAGFSYYEEFSYADWAHIGKMFDTNVLSVMYSYQKYYQYLNGKEGHFAITLSAIGKMAMPGYAVYSASKFALQGFQEAVRLEKQKNITLTCLYPVATNTEFFKENADPKYKKPFPMQQPQVVAKAMVKGLLKKKKYVYPCKMFLVSQFLIKFFPFIRNIYWSMEYKKYKTFVDDTRKGD
jgi:short-subunit dehydrogenase